MCGIAGILKVHPAGVAPPPPEVAIPDRWLDILDDSIKHRGPDGQGRFRDRATGCTYVHLNTHFDHRGEQARQESARLIRERLATIDAAGLPLVMTGDLNSRPTSVGYRILTRDTIANAFPPLVDGMTASRDGHYGPPSSTVSGFRGIGREGDVIDYVLVSPAVEVRKRMA